MTGWLRTISSKIGCTLCGVLIRRTRGFSRRMAGLEIVDVVVLGDLGRAGHELRHHLAHPSERGAVQHLRHHDHAVAAVSLDIPFRNHPKDLLRAQ